MKPRITVYLTEGQLDHLRREAARQRVSLSRYATERLSPLVEEEDGSDVPAEKLATSLRKMLAERADALAENLRTVIVMLDQLVRLSTPDEQHYRAWQQTVEELLRQTRTQAVAERQNGQRSARVISPQQIQERRRDELLRRQLGPQLLAAIADPAITDIIVNEDGRVWFEAHGKGLYAAGFVLPESHRESLIGTVAAALGTTADNDHPIVEGELADRAHSFRGTDVARWCGVPASPCANRRRCSYTLDDYVRDGIVTEAQAEIFRDATHRRLNIAIAGGTGSGKTTSRAR